MGWGQSLRLISNLADAAVSEQTNKLRDYPKNVFLLLQSPSVTPLPAPRGLATFPLLRIGPVWPGDVVDCLSAIVYCSQTLSSDCHKFDLVV